MPVGACSSWSHSLQAELRERWIPVLGSCFRNQPTTLGKSLDLSGLSLPIHEVYRMQPTAQVAKENAYACLSKTLPISKTSAVIFIAVRI